MASQALTTTPATVTLAAGAYFVQNLGSQPMSLRVQISTANAPDADSTDIIVLAPLNVPFPITQAAGRDFYVWNGSGVGAVSVQPNPFD